MNVTTSTFFFSNPLKRFPFFFSLHSQADQYKQKESVNEKILRINGCPRRIFCSLVWALHSQPRRETVKEEGIDYSSRESTRLSQSRSRQCFARSVRAIFPDCFHHLSLGSIIGRWWMNKSLQHKDIMRQFKFLKGRYGKNIRAKNFIRRSNEWIFSCFEK